MFLREGVFLALQALWIGPFLIIGLDIPPLKAGNLLLALYLGVIIGAPTGGFIAERILNSPRRAGMMSLALMSLAILSLTFWSDSSSLLPLVGVLFVIGFCAPFANLLFAHAARFISPNFTGMAFSGMNLSAHIGGGMFLYGLGYMMDKASAGESLSLNLFQNAFYICCITLVVTLLLYKYCKEI
jgi:predicted MFS family arabinose efflux permease